MILISIELENFKSYYGNHKFDLNKINLVVGNNGIGKSTLIKDSIKFCLYGETSKKKTFADLPTRGKADSCAVTLTFDINGIEYKITRSYPTKLVVKVNGEIQRLGTASQAQNYINSLFGTSEIFKKFRMIDVREGINILEGSELDLKKTLFANDDDSLSRVRTQLLGKISEIETYLKNNKRSPSPHYPSNIREAFLKETLAKASKKYNNLLDEESKVSIDINKCLRNISIAKSNINSTRSKKMLLSSESVDSICPECKQAIKNKEVLEELLDKYQNSIAVDTGTLMFEESLRTKLELKLDSLREESNRASKIINRCNQLLYKLSLAFKKELVDKYIEKDLVLAKNVLSKFDEFGSFYVKKQLEYLEPVINEIALIIGIQVNFSLDEKGKLSIEMIKDNEIYTYEDISEGQKLIIGIAFKLAILMRDGSFGIVIADEGLSSLDDENLPKIFDLFSGTNFQLLSVVHRFSNINDINIIDLNKL